jgi:hypothetical protein
LNGPSEYKDYHVAIPFGMWMYYFGSISGDRVNSHSTS